MFLFFLLVRVFTLKTTPQQAECGTDASRSWRTLSYLCCLDVRVRDCLCCPGVVAGTTTLDGFQGVVFVGGFSYADVLDSAKGWAATIKFNPKVG